jgi:hypothetical protein
LADWAHSGWDLLTYGSAAQRTELSAHIEEVSEHITNRNYSVQGKSHSADALSRYLDRLMAIQADLLAKPITPVAETTEPTYFVQGKAVMP